MPGIILGPGNAAVNKIDTILHMHGSCTLVGEKQAINQISMSLCMWSLWRRIKLHIRLENYENDETVHLNQVVREELIGLEEVEEQGAAVWVKSVLGRGNTEHKALRLACLSNREELVWLEQSK